MKMFANRTAFTLLEMSVVLVIIGLMAGAVLATQSYMRNAQLTTIITDAKYYRDALNRFEAQYLAAPGDLTNASAIWPGSNNGDGDGLIAFTSMNETFYAWQHLANAGMIEGSYSGAPGSGGVQQALPGVNVPEGSITRVTYFFFDFVRDNIGSGSNAYFEGFYRRPLFVGLSTATGLPNNGFLTPREAFQLDDKFDDGKPGMGSIRTPNNIAIADCANNSVALTAIYLVDTSAKSCRFILTQP